MANDSLPNLCAICETFSDQQKPKLGILLCQGCEKYFCSTHMIQHRRNLTDLLEIEVINQRNELQEKFLISDEKQWSSFIEVRLEEINKWQVNTTELIKQSAECARRQLREVASQEYDKLKKNFSSLSNQLTMLHENESYFENDIDQLKQKFQQLKHAMEKFPVDIVFETMPNESALVKIAVQPMHAVTPSYRFIDQLLTLQQSEKSIELSKMKVGRMYPINHSLVAFYDENELPALETCDYSWHSLQAISGAIELHWSDYLQRFFILKYSNSHEKLKRVYDFDPESGVSKEVFKISYTPYQASSYNATTLTCFKHHILIVENNNIERRYIYNKESYHRRSPVNRWTPPISCRSSFDIKCVRMNDLYYAVILQKTTNNSPANSADEFVFELRSHGMSVLHQMTTDYYDMPRIMRLLSLSDNSGWLFFWHDEEAPICYILDNKGQRYDQNTVLSSNVTDVTIENNHVFIRKTKTTGTEEIQIYDCKLLEE